MVHLQIKQVGKSFRKKGEDVWALKPTDLTVEKGSFVSIIGPSGCGKSTMFHLIAGLMKPTCGEVCLNGTQISANQGDVGYMLQKDLLLPWRTILENVILGMEVKGIPKKEAVERALPLMEKYGLKGFDAHYPDELSGGMRQRAALLRTLLYDAELLLLDEPFAALDAQTRAAMQEWLLRIWGDFKKTVLFVTHDIDESIFLSDVIYVFSPRPGRLKAKVDVRLARPRTEGALLSREYIELKKKLLSLLHDEEEAIRQTV